MRERIEGRGRGKWNKMLQAFTNVESCHTIIFKIIHFHSQGKCGRSLML